MNKIIRFNPQLELLVFPDTGRGLASTIKLKAGDSLIKIPLTSIITKQLIQQKLKNESIQFLTETQALVLFILDQILNSDEEYMEYIATLPTHFNTLPLTYPLELQSYFDAGNLFIFPLITDRNL